jgi:hypothetical protein
MNVATDKAKTQVSGPESIDKAPFNGATVAVDNKVCLIEVKQMPYLPDQQVELLHLQAEADALLLQLQSIQQKRQSK